LDQTFGAEGRVRLPIGKEPGAVHVTALAVLPGEAHRGRWKDSIRAGASELNPAPSHAAMTVRTSRVPTI
jgi:hypothetical protein